jgi:hypothetical protein
LFAPFFCNHDSRLLPDRPAKLRDASLVRGIGVLPVFAGFIGLLLLIGSLAATWAREGR